jgi:uncharacterized protein (DUF1330 family)
LQRGGEMDRPVATGHRRWWRWAAATIAFVTAPVIATRGVAGDAGGQAALHKPPAACERPAYLVVVATITDPVKSRRYVEALRASGLYPSTGGSYITSGKSPEVLEGEMFREKPIVIARFPCAEAARRFWHSETYQREIMPLRDGAGTFEVAIFEERLDDMRPRPAG